MRPAIALDPCQFGRRASRLVGAHVTPTGLADDVKLFATAFLGGFLFVAVYLA